MVISFLYYLSFSEQNIQFQAKELVLNKLPTLIPLHYIHCFYFFLENSSEKVFL